MPVVFEPLSPAIVRLGRAHRAPASQLMREVTLRPEQGALMMHLRSRGPAGHLVEPTAAGNALRARLEHIVVDALSPAEREIALPLILRRGDIVLRELDADAASTLNEI